MRIIGIDPGTAICGYGIIDVKGSKLTPVAYGAITTPKELTDSQRLEILFNDLSDLLEDIGLISSVWRNYFLTVM